MTQKEKDIMKNYADLKIKIKELDLVAKEMNEEVLGIMNKEEMEEVEIDGVGKLSIGSRRTWKYTPALNTMKDQLKDRQQEEEQTGVALYEEKHYLLFKANKYE